MANAIIGALRVSLGIDSAEFTSGAKKAQSQAAALSSKLSGSFKNAQTSVIALTSATRSLAGPLAAITGVGSAASFLAIADEAKNLSSQMKLATAQSGNFAVAMADADRIANVTRSGLTETAALYGNFVRATQQMGGTQAEAARATETFSKALKIGGADANMAASATLQFGQALASGVLRGDEFNSIMEASPRIARLLADSLGVPLGSLRAMAEQGKLTSDVLMRALTDTKFTAGIDAEFKQLPVTFDQAMTLVHNAAITTFGAFDQGGQFSTMIADFVGRGADGFKDLAHSAEAEGINIRAAFESLHNVFQPLLSGARDAFSGVRQEANYTRDTIASILDGVDQLRNFLPDLQRRAQQFDEQTFGRRLGVTGDVGPRSDLSGQFRKGYDQAGARGANASRDRALDAQWGSGFQRYMSDPSKYDILGNPLAGSRPRPKTGGGGGAGAGGGRSTGRRGGTGKTLSSETQSILDSVLPDDAQARELREKMATLGRALAANLLPLDVYDKAKDAIQKKLDDLAPDLKTSKDLLDGSADLTIPLTTARAGAGEVAVSYDAIKNANIDLGVSFRDMVMDIDGALQHLAGSLRNGDILGIVEGVLGLFTSLGSTGLLGKGLQTKLAGARAAGGPVIAGQSYLTGERGMEIFTPKQSGYVTANKDLGRMGGAVVQLVVGEGQMFEPRVTGIAGDVSVQTVGRAGAAQGRLRRRTLVR